MKKQEFEQIMTAILGYPCKVEKQKEVRYTVNVFNVPQEKKSQIQDLGHVSVEILEKLTGDNLFTALIVSTPKETREYYPRQKDAVAEKQTDMVEGLASLVRAEALKEVNG
ncbi:MAG: hypothetical protein J6Y62_04510 [Clostridia bacterium]|nr:hypothetical protein [Clostridia bacterium]